MAGLAACHRPAALDHVRIACYSYGMAPTKETLHFTVADAVAAATCRCFVVTADGWWIAGLIEAV